MEALQVWNRQQNVHSDEFAALPIRVRQTAARKKEGRDCLVMGTLWTCLKALRLSLFELIRDAARWRCGVHADLGGSFIPGRVEARGREWRNTLELRFGA